MKTARYKALADCRAGGMYRKKGELFSMPALDSLPPHLQEVRPAPDNPAAGKASGRKATARPPKALGAAAEDMGLGPARPAADLTAGVLLPRPGKHA